MGSEQANTNPNSLNGIPAREAADISMTDAPTDQSAVRLSLLPTLSFYSQRHLHNLIKKEINTIQLTLPPLQQQPPQPPQPTTTTTPSAAPSPIPLPAIARIPTPTPGGAATDQRSTSRATSAHPDPTSNTSGATGFTMPAEAAAHGAPVRQYINSKITGVLLEGMKIVAREQ